MKKTAKILFAVVCLVCVFGMLTLAACDRGEVIAEAEKTVTVVIGEEEAQSITVTTGAKYLFDVLNELAQREEEPVALGGSWGAFGLFVTEVGSIKAEAANEYIAILTTDGSHQDITEYAIEKSYDGKSLKSASLGVSSLPIKDGETYMFVLATY